VNHVLSVIVILLMAGASRGAVYYIDFNNGKDGAQGTSKVNAWKHSPAQTGFGGRYTHAAGDRFVFKGGTIWPSSTLPLHIRHSGTWEKYDAYTADSTWYQGNFFTRPVFTGEHRKVALVFAENESCFVLNGLAFMDYGVAGEYNGGKGLECNGCSRYTIQNCTITPNAWLGLYLHSYRGIMAEQIIIEGCDISAAGQAIVIATEAANTIFKGVLIRNNRIHDLSSQIAGPTHGDGIHTWNSPDSDLSQYITDLTITANVFDGDFSRIGPGEGAMTSLIYLTDPGMYATISENVLTYSKATSFASLIWVRNFDEVKIYNNTLVQKPEIGGIGIIVGQGRGRQRTVITNNIIDNCQSAYYIYADASPAVKIDHNCCVTTSRVIGYWNGEGKDAQAWRALGNDLSGIFSSKSSLSPVDFRLQSDSPCFDHGMGAGGSGRID